MITIERLAHFLVLEVEPPQALRYTATTATVAEPTEALLTCYRCRFEEVGPIEEMRRKYFEHGLRVHQLAAAP